MKLPPQQRVAIIDLGSNTARLVVMNTHAGYSYRLTDQVREVVRLRQGMTAAGLSEAAFKRGFSTLRLFKNFCDSVKVDTVIATATSAIRDAANGRVFLEKVREEIGLELRVLSGEREAYYDTLGALNEVTINEGTVLDIGGGSFQLSNVQKRNYHEGVSFPLGALALTERFVENDLVSDEEVEQIKAEVERALDQVDWLEQKQGHPLVGLGGTIRNLAKIQTARENYPLYTLHGFKLTRKSITESIQLFRELPLNERKNISGLAPDRADIILAGAVTLLTVMEKLNAKEIIISENGVREGLFMEYFWEHLDPPIIPSVRRFSVLNLARHYQYEKRHANHVRFLSDRLFWQLVPLHGLGPDALDLLDAASLLHDIGRIISYSSHHHHSKTLIENAGLPGFTPREIALVGLLSRYHRKGSPSIEGYETLLDKKDEKLLEHLSAILRMAETLERGRNGNVSDVIVTHDDDDLRITLITNTYPAVELWQAEWSAIPLMAEVYERNVTLDSFAPPVEDHYHFTEEDGE